MFSYVVIHQVNEKNERRRWIRFEMIEECSKSRNRQSKDANFPIGLSVSKVERIFRAQHSESPGFQGIPSIFRVVWNSHMQHSEGERFSRVFFPSCQNAIGFRLSRSMLRTIAQDISAVIFSVSGSFDPFRRGKVNSNFDLAWGN